MSDLDPRPIGVFDSGVGGLSVLSELLKAFPSESFVYLGDTARLPYGSKSPQTIAKYVDQNINYLLKYQNIKAVVVACNSASTVLSEVKATQKIPTFGVILPGAKAAYATSKNQIIGVWATRATIHKDSYNQALIQLNPKIKTISVACPLLVPLVEEGLWDGPITTAILDLYLTQLTGTKADTLILGCTHYPFIRQALEQRIQAQSTNMDLHPELKIMDSAQAISMDLKSAIAHKIIKPSASRNSLSLLLTDEASHFMNLVEKAFPSWGDSQFHLIDLQAF